MGNVAESAAVAYSGTRDEESRAHVRRGQRIVLECDCGERLVLLGSVTVRKAGCVVECDCGEEFTLAGHLTVREPEAVGNGYWEVRGREEKRRYSWVDDCLKWLEGKEAREEYYARLEQVA